MTTKKIAILWVGLLITAVLVTITATYSPNPAQAHSTHSAATYERTEQPPSAWQIPTHQPAIPIDDADIGPSATNHQVENDKAVIASQNFKEETFLPDSDAAIQAILGNWFKAADGRTVEAAAYNARFDEYIIAWSEIGGSGYADLYVRVFDNEGQPAFPTQQVGPRGQSYTRIAYNHIEDEYLVAWDPQWFAIATQRLSFSGIPQGSQNRFINNIGMNGGVVDIAFNSRDNEYLVVFNIVGDSDWTVNGQLINTNGSSKGSPFAIGPDRFLGGGAVYNFTNNIYLVVGQWSGAGSNSWDIHGQFVRTNGSLQGSRFLIETDNNAQDLPRVAWNSTDNEYMVIWRDKFLSLDEPDIFGRRLNANGAVFGNYVPVAINNYSKHPNELIYNPNGNSYMAMWSVLLFANSQEYHWSYVRSLSASGEMHLPEAMVFSATGRDPVLTRGTGQAYLPVIEVNNEIWARFATTSRQLFLPVIINQYTPETVPNDPLLSQQWALPRIDAFRAWSISQGSPSVIIAVIDTGVDRHHPDLAPNLRPDLGYNFVSRNTNTQDDQGHGTHVAGIAAAVTNNNVGIAGIAGRSQIMPIKVLNNQGSGQLGWAAEAIYFATNNGAKVINLSLGAPNLNCAIHTPYLQDAISYAHSRGVIVIAAAGNNSTSVPSTPATCTHALAISSTDANDSLSSFSNYGNYISLAAPGGRNQSNVQIMSTCWSGDVGTAYCGKSGTSMAAPQVAGVAALIFARYPSYTPNQVASALLDNAADLGPAGWDSSFGCGRVDAYQSLLQGARASQPICNRPAFVANVDIEAEVLPFTPAEAAYVPGEVIVRLQNGVAMAAAEQIFAAYSNEVVNLGASGLWVLTVPVGEETAVIHALEADDYILYARPNYLVGITD